MFMSWDVCFQSNMQLLGQSINAYMVLLHIAEFPFREVVTFCIKEITVFPTIFPREYIVKLLNFCQSRLQYAAKRT